MAEIVNLRQARKNKARQEKERQADANRALHGRTKAEKQFEKRQSDTINRHLDAHQLDKDKSKDAES